MNSMKAIENFDYYSEERVLNPRNRIEEVAKSQKFYYFISNQGMKVKISLLFNGDIEYQGENFDDFLKRMDLIEIDDCDEVTLKVQYEKKASTGIFMIFDDALFTEFLLTHSIEHQVRIINKKLLSNYTSIVIKGCKVHLSSEEIATSRTENMMQQKFFEKAYGENLPPSLLYNLAEKISVKSNFKDYLLMTGAILALSLISRESDMKEKVFSFDNNRSFSLKNLPSESLPEFSSGIYAICEWIHSDGGISTKKAIFNSVISLQADIISSINCNLINILSSNLKILYKENFQNYMNSRNSILDFLYEISVKINDSILHKMASSKNAFLALISYFFSLVVFTGIDKGKVTNIFSFEISMLSFVFIISAMIFIIFNHVDLGKTVAFHLQQKREFKKRNEDIFSKNELDELFQSESLDALVEQAKSTRYLYIYQALLCLILFIILISHFMLPK